jgi:hypothetical protein
MAFGEILFIFREVVATGGLEPTTTALSQNALTH